MPEADTPRSRRILPIVLVGLSCLGILLFGWLAFGKKAEAAHLAPADTALFVEVRVRPEGDSAEAVQSFARKVFGAGDSGAGVGQLVEDALAVDGGRVSFQRDIEPWLGGRVGAFVTGDASSPGVTLICEVRDEEAAADFAEEPKPKGSYRGRDGRRLLRRGSTGRRGGSQKDRRGWRLAW